MSCDKQQPTNQEDVTGIFSNVNPETFSKVIDKIDPRLAAHFIDMFKPTEPEDHNHEIGDMVLVKADQVGNGGQHERLKAIITDIYDNSVGLTTQFRSGHFKEGIYSPEVITDTLGGASFEDLQTFGIVNVTPEKYQTGTYIITVEGMPGLIEVDRVGNDYYFHLAGDHEMIPLTDGDWDDLEQFSDDPSGTWEGYLLEPGIYMNPSLNLVEVVPYRGASYYRYSDECMLNLLSPNQAKECKRIESDHLEVNAVAIIPEQVNAELAQQDDDETVLQRETERTSREPRPTEAEEASLAAGSHS